MYASLLGATAASAEVFPPHSLCGHPCPSLCIPLSAALTSNGAQGGCPDSRGLLMAAQRQVIAACNQTRTIRSQLQLPFNFLSGYFRVTLGFL